MSPLQAELARRGFLKPPAKRKAQLKQIGWQTHRHVGTGKTVEAPIFEEVRPQASWGQRFKARVTSLLNGGL
jgi:hypothetical protein